MTLPSSTTGASAAIGPTGDERGSIRKHLCELHRLLLATIVALLVMSLGVNLFIFQQMRGVRTQLAAARTVERNLADQYQVKEPAMRQFVAALHVFAVTHPDFRPILQRYRAGLPQFFADLETSVSPSTNPARRPPARP